MRKKLKFCWSHENFDFYFAKQVEALSQYQKESLPKELNFMLFRKGGIFNAPSTNKLSILAKLYVLLKVARKRFYLVIEDEEEGIRPSDFFGYKADLKKAGYMEPFVEEYTLSGGFILGSKELVDTFDAMNRLCLSPAYNYFNKVKNLPRSKTTQWKQEAVYIANYMANYESIKKKIVLNMGLSMAEFYTLLDLYDGREKVASTLYKEKFKYAYNASRAQIQAGFVTLQKKGFIEKIGRIKGAKLKITALGSDKIDEILCKYIIDC